MCASEWYGETVAEILTRYYYDWDGTDMVGSRAIVVEETVDWVSYGWCSSVTLTEPEDETV